MRTALGRLAGPAPHLRWRLARAGEPLGDHELSCGALAADPDALATAVAASAAGRGSDDPQVLASLWWQAYAYRVAGTALACWLLTGCAPRSGAEHTAVGIARSRPSSVVYRAVEAPPADLPGAGSRPGAVDPGARGVRTSSPEPRPPAGGSHGPAVTDGDAGLDALVEGLFPAHLDRVAASLRARHALGRSLVWGNVAAAVASAAGAVRVAAGPGWRARLDTFLAAAPHDLARFGRWTPPPDASDASDAPGAAGADRSGTCVPTTDPTYRRTTCCLWWKTSASSGALCADCSLTRPPIETSPS